MRTRQHSQIINGTLYLITLVFLGWMFLAKVATEFITGVLALALIFANNMQTIIGYHFGGSEGD